MKKVIYRTKYLTQAERQFISETLGIPATQLDARRRGVTPEWLQQVLDMAYGEARGTRY